MAEWISVKDRMPEKDGRYLVHDVYANDMIWIGVCSLRQGKWDDSGVTHWMSLPEPPK